MSLFHCLPMSSGSASPAEMQRRSGVSQLALPASICASSAAYRVGTPQKIVGLCLLISANTESGVGLPESNTVVAPTDRGKVIALPSP